jgi:hypothetical protein
MRFAKVLATAALAAALCAPAAAFAATTIVDVNFGVIGQISITYDPSAVLEPISTLDGTSIYNVESASGTVFGTTVNGVVPNPHTDGTAALFGSIFYDNDFCPACAIDKIDSAGWLLTTTIPGLDFNFRGGGSINGAPVYSMDAYYFGSHLGQTSNVMQSQVSFAVRNSVPEPATWLLMIIGFLGAGAMLRRRATASA